MKWIQAAATALAMGCTGGSAFADVVFSNVGSAAPVSGQHFKFPSALQPIAMPFTVAAGTDFDLTRIDIGLTFDSQFPGVNAAVVELAADTLGLPGAILGSWVLSGLPDLGTTTLQSSQSISGLGGIQLDGGSQYWLIAVGLSSNIAWGYATPEVIGPFAFSSDAGATWSLSQGSGTSAFDVLGTPISVSPVPEPASASLYVSGLLALLVATRRRRQCAAQPGA